jgi:outer membrane protein TolC
VIHAELELSRLNERLSSLWQAHDGAQQALGEWLSAEQLSRAWPDNLQNHLQSHLHKDDLTLNSVKDKQQAKARIVKHPRVQALERNIASITTGLELAQQQYKPEWGINAAYAYRDDGPRGDDRADFVSMAITVDLPLFTANRQDQRVSAASHRRAAAQTERDLLLRELLSGYEQAGAELLRLDERVKLYQQYLLPQIHDQADATLAAYTSDGGDFAEVMRARIGELNTKIMALQLKVKRQKTLAKMHYFLVANSASASLDGELK